MGDAYNREAFGAGPGWDLITANILSGPLIEIAPRLAAALEPGGLVILSGILGHQERGVRAAYRAAGLRGSSAVRLGEWPTLILRRPDAG